MSKFKFFLVFGVVALLTAPLIGCQTAPAMQVPQLSFAHLGTIKLVVGRKEVASTFTMSLKKPHIEHELGTSPEKAFRLWVDQRIATRGQGGYARFILEDASVVEVPLERTKGVKALFTEDQSERYEASISATVELYDADGKKLGFASASARHTQTIGESATLNEREQLLFELVEKLMLGFDKAFEANIKAHLGSWVG